MPTKLTLFLIVSACLGAGFVAGWFGSVTASAPPSGPALVFVHAAMANSAQFVKYAELTKPLVGAAGGSLLIAPTNITHLSLEQNGDAEDIVPFANAGTEKGILLQFPSLDVAKEWYTSHDYQEAIAIRLTAADMIFTAARISAEIQIEAGAYVIVVGTVKNGDKLSEYASNVGATIVKHEGSIAVPPTPRETLSDRQLPFVATKGTRVFIMLRFPSSAKAKDWYADEEYQELIETREAAMDAILSIVNVS
jgi:uncharacterized protein (DUF1330 family)